MDIHDVLENIHELSIQSVEVVQHPVMLSQE